MHRILPVLIACVMAVPVFAQRGGHGGGFGGGMRGGGMAGGGMRGGGMTGGFRGGGFTGFRGGFTGNNFRGGGFRAGFRGNFNRGFEFRGSRFGIVPFYSFYGGYGYYDPFIYNSYPSSYPSSYPAPYPYAYPYAGYASGTPSVMIISNEPDGYAPAPPPPAPPAPEPAVREFAHAPDNQRYDTPLYLVAFKDSTIRAVLAYWVDGATLYYVTMDHEQKQAPLSSVDHDLSDRLNHERNVTFRLPR